MMTLAEQKLKQNVAEYLLFLWQMEDLVRAVYFDPDALDEFIRTYTPNEEAFQLEKRWFRELVRKMRSERVEVRGHVSDALELLFELNYLHGTLLNVFKDKTYSELYRAAKPHIEAYTQRTDGKALNEIETCLTALYGLLLLRLKKETISAETEESMATFTALMARLAHHYKLMKQGELNFSQN